MERKKSSTTKSSPENCEFRSWIDDDDIQTNDSLRTAGSPHILCRFK